MLHMCDSNRFVFCVDYFVVLVDFVGLALALMKSIGQSADMD